jgi:hypothetical protein
MKSSRLLTLATLMLFAFSLASWAKTKDSADVTLPQAVEISGTHLAPGSYHLLWTGSGPNVKVSFLQGRKQVVTAPATLEQHKDPYSGTALVTKAAPSGAPQLAGIMLRDVTLHFRSASSK